MIGGHNTYDGLTVDGCVVNGDGLGYASGRNTKFLNNTVEGNYDCANGGILVNAAAGGVTQIIGNKIICPTTQIGMQLKGRDMMVLGNDVESGTAYGSILVSGVGSNSIFRGNKIQNTNGGGSCLRIANGNAASGPTENIQITGNQFDMTYQGIKIEPQNEDIENVSVSDNDFIGGSNAGFIALHDEATEAIHFKIFNNRLNGCGGGIGTTGMRYVDIYGNDFRDITNNGINIRYDLDNNLDHINAWDNHFKNCGTDINYGTGQIQNSITSRQNLDTFLHVLAANTTYVHAAVAGQSSPRVVSSLITNPDVPRIVSITTTNNDTPSGNVEVVGVDARGYPVTENITISAGGTAFSNAAFATVSQYTIPAGVSSSDSVSMGIGDKLGLSNWIWAAADVYKVSKTSPEEFSAVSVYLDTNQAINANTWTKVEFDTEDYDSLSEFDPSSDFDFTATYAGQYAVRANIFFDVGAADDILEVAVYVNGSEVKKVDTGYAYNGRRRSILISAVVDLAASDLVTIYARNRDTNDTIQSLEDVTWCMINRIVSDEFKKGDNADITDSIGTPNTTYHTVDPESGGGIPEGTTYSVWYRSSLNIHN
jgi:hypothetical protein